MTSAVHGINSHDAVSVRYSNALEMEENEMVRYLTNGHYNKREDALEGLRAVVRRSHSQLPFTNPKAIFRGLAAALTDETWDTRYQCIKLINDVIPLLGDQTESSVKVILGPLIQCIGDSKITVSTQAIQTLETCTKHLSDSQIIVRAIQQYGFEDSDLQLKKAVIANLHLILTREYVHTDLSSLIESLLNLLYSISDIQDILLVSLEKISELVGQTRFEEYIRSMPELLKRKYCRLTGMQVHTQSTDMPRDSSQQKPSPTHDRGNSSYEANDTDDYQRPSQRQAFTDTPSSRTAIGRQSSGYNDTLMYGIIPHRMKAQLFDQNIRVRSQAIEELKLMIDDSVNLDAIFPHMPGFLSFLGKMLEEEVSFQIVTMLLDIMRIIVERLGTSLRDYLKPIISAVTKQMDNSNLMVRKAIMKLAMKLMQILPPNEVLLILCENLSNRNSKIRQETLNVIIASLLKHPSYVFDLALLCQTIANTLIDSKRNVRQAALETFAVIAQAMGAGKQQPLVAAVDSLELNYEGEGVMTAVQARLARRQLPVVNDDGIVEYASQMNSRGMASAGADIDWIQSGSSSVAMSTKSNYSDTMELESATSSARSSPPSARKSRASASKSRLPWERDLNINDVSQFIDIYFVYVEMHCRGLKSDLTI